QGDERPRLFAREPRPRTEKPIVQLHDLPARQRDGEVEALAHIVELGGDPVELLSRDDGMSPRLHHASPEAGHETAVARDDDERPLHWIVERYRDAVSPVRQLRLLQEKPYEQVVTVKG